LTRVLNCRRKTRGEKVYNLRMKTSTENALSESTVGRLNQNLKTEDGIKKKKCS